jgi:hypothetical protein
MRPTLTGAPAAVLNESDPPRPAGRLASALNRALDLLVAGDRTVVLITHRPYGLSEVDELSTLPYSAMSRSAVMRCIRSRQSISPGAPLRSPYQRALSAGT